MVPEGATPFSPQVKNVASRDLPDLHGTETFFTVHLHGGGKQGASQHSFGPPALNALELRFGS